MKAIINSFKILIITSLSLVFPACSEDIMDNINKDTSHTNSVEGKFIMTDVITSTAFSNVGGDFNTYFSSYLEYEVGIDNQLYNAETRLNEPSAASTFNNIWSGTYTSLKNARIIINQCEEGGRDEGNYVTKGAAEVMAAYNSALLADMFGDTPYSQAAVIDENGSPLYMTPKIDKQEEIYITIMTLLDDAIINLQKEDLSPLGSYDLLYNGNAEKWLKFAYGLKARYTMRLLNRSSNKNGDLEKVLEYTSKSFSSAGEQAAFTIYDVNNINPFYGFFASRAAFANSESLGTKLDARQDPRLTRVMLSPTKEGKRIQIKGTSDPNYIPAPNGNPEQNMQKYGVSAFVYSGTAPTLLLSYHEVKFLEAEALCRLNRTSEAETALKEAITNAILNTENSVVSAITTLGSDMIVTSQALTEEIATSYFDVNVKPLFAANPLQEVMLQKYLAFWGASGEATESFNDVRRLKAEGKDFYAFKNTKKFPLRCPYGNSDTSANPEVKAAYGDGQYIYTEQVWWAGGNR